MRFDRTVAGVRSNSWAELSQNSSPRAAKVAARIMPAKMTPVLRQHEILSFGRMLISEDAEYCRQRRFFSSTPLTFWKLHRTLKEYIGNRCSGRVPTAGG